MKAPVEIAERHTQVAGVDVVWRQAGDAQILYLHGVPAAGWQWEPFLARTGGSPRPEGHGARQARRLDYSIPGYDRSSRRSANAAGLDRVTLVMHDWGSVGLAFAQRCPSASSGWCSRLCVPFVPGYRCTGRARVGARRSWASC